MKTIWKFNVGTDDFALEMPLCSQILDVQLQRDQVQMWALVDPASEKITRHFVTCATGRPIDNPNELTYVGTFQVSDYLVFHLFEKDTLPF